MIGLKYILELNNNMNYTTLAKRLNIHVSNISIWVNCKRIIPSKYLLTLSEIFQISQCYFQKEINEDDKIKIQEVNQYNIDKKKVDNYELTDKGLTTMKYFNTPYGVCGTYSPRPIDGEYQLLYSSIDGKYTTWVKIKDLVNSMKEAKSSKVSVVIKKIIK